MKKKEIIICLIVLLISIVSISVAVKVKETKKPTYKEKNIISENTNEEQTEENENNTSKLANPIDYDDLERNLMNLVNNDGYSIIKRSCVEKNIKNKINYVKTDNKHVSTKSISDLLTKLKEAPIVIEQDESNVCPSVAYYVASDTDEVFQVFTSSDNLSFTVKVNNTSYNFKYEDESKIKNFIENLK